MIAKVGTNLNHIDIKKHLLDIYNKKFETSYKHWFDIEKTTGNIDQNKKFFMINQLRAQGIDEYKIQNLLNDQNFCKNFLIMSQSKATLRGAKLNNIVYNICRNYLNNRYFIVETEKHYDNISEKVDVLITQKSTGRKLLIFNQIDLWGGGAQYNRGDKYILQDCNNKVCKTQNDKCIYTIIKPYGTRGNMGSKKHQICFLGYVNELLFYPEELPLYIKNFFNL